MLVKIHYVSGRSREGEISGVISSALSRPFFLLKVGTAKKEVAVITKNVEEIESIE